MMEKVEKLTMGQEDSETQKHHFSQDIAIHGMLTIDIFIKVRHVCCLSNITECVVFLFSEVANINIISMHCFGLATIVNNRHPDKAAETD